MAYANKLHPFLMQGPYATLSLSHSLSLCRFLPFIQLQMLSYCIFALRPFKIPFEICRLISTSLAKSPQWLGLDFNVPATERETSAKERENWENWWCWGTELCTSTLKSAHLFTDEMQEDALSPFRSSLTPLCNSSVIKMIRFPDYWGILWKLFPGLTLFKSWWLD